MDHKIYCAIINKCEHYVMIIWWLLLFNLVSLCGEAGMIYKCYVSLLSPFKPWIILLILNSNENI